jgi:hypothetical protein
MFSDTLTLKRWLIESDTHFSSTKAFGKKVREYFNGDQLDETIKSILANRGQPEQYENNIAKHHNNIMGHKSNREIEIKIFARQQEKRASANILNAIVKAITQVNEYQSECEQMDDELAIEGISICDLMVKGTGEYDIFNREHKDIDPSFVPSREMFLDPFSRANNYNDDARYIHRCVWVDREDLYKFGFDEEKIELVSNNNYLNSMVEDDLYTDDTLRSRVLLTYTWYRKWCKEEKKDKFYYCFWCDDVILKQEENPFKHNEFPYEIEFFQRDTGGDIKYWGLYRDIMPLQDNINYAKLRLQNMLANTKTYVNKGAIIDQDIAQFNYENSFDNATVVVEDINGIKDVKQNAQIQQILNTIIDNRNQITERLNSNKEMLGMANNRMSGVGQEQRIQSGLVGLSRFMNKSDNLQKRIIRKKISLIVQFYDTSRIVSIVDEDYVQDFLSINEPLYNDDGGVDYDLLEDGSVVPIAMNTLEFDKYDLVYLAKPKSNRMSEDRLRLNGELLRTVRENKPELLDMVIPAILKDMESPDAKKVKDAMEAQALASQNSPEAQRLRKLEEEKMRLEMMYKHSQTSLNNAKAKAMVDKNKIDLQKAFANSVMGNKQIEIKQQKNMIDAGRRV